MKNVFVPLKETSLSISCINELEKNKELSQDARDAGQEQLQKHTDSYIEKVNELLEQKESEIIQV